MENYKKEFIDFLYQNQVLSFGNFTLKSGRSSPYFFNLGLFNSGASLQKLGEFYADALAASGFQYDLLFGPAYKGIPLVVATAIGLYRKYQKDTPYCFNRKEKKTHGDQGALVGATLQGRVVMVDDVITAGTTVRETLQLMSTHPVKLAGILIAFDRQERGQGKTSAIAEVSQEFGIPVYSIISVKDVLEYLGENPQFQHHYQAIKDYQNQYGA